MQKTTRVPVCRHLTGDRISQEHTTGKRLCRANQRTGSSRGFRYRNDVPKYDRTDTNDVTVTTLHVTMSIEFFEIEKSIALRSTSSVKIMRLSAQIYACKDINE